MDDLPRRFPDRDEIAMVRLRQPLFDEGDALLVENVAPGIIRIDHRILRAVSLDVPQ